MTLGEDEVDHPQDIGEPGGERISWWDLERDRGLADLALGAHQALRHGRLRHQERRSDLGSGETADRPERQRDTHTDVECRVTAHEDEAQLVIPRRPLVCPGGGITELAHGCCLLLRSL